jgi:hypothetical protein
MVRYLLIFVKILRIRLYGSAAIHFCMCFLYIFAFFLGSVLSPGVRASLVGLVADAPGCRGLDALGGPGRLGWLPATLNR